MGKKTEMRENKVKIAKKKKVFLHFRQLEAENDVYILGSWKLKTYLNSMKTSWKLWK